MDREVSPTTIKALLDLRSTKAGRLLLLEREAAELKIQLAHLDATILMVDPSADLGALSPRLPRSDAGAARQPVMRVVLTALRTSTNPMTTADLALSLIRDRGIAAPTAKEKSAMAKRADNCLRKLKKRGVVEIVPSSSPVNYWWLSGQDRPREST